MSRKRLAPLMLSLAGLLALTVSRCTSPAEATTPPVAATAAPEAVTVRVLYAGSMILPFADLEEAFEQAYPHVDLQGEGHGSIQVMRHVSELHERVDVVITADHALIPMLMISVSDPESGRPYADWYLEFATNHLALAYTDRSLYADEITADNWYQVIARHDVRLGLADPRFDAAGYRGLMALQLAELAYDNPIIWENVIMGSFRDPIQALEEDGRWVIHIPEIVDPKADSGIVMRGSSVQLVALLESGDIDYAFEYESVSQQHGFSTIDLPDEIDMGSEAHAADYARVEVREDFQRFATVEPVFGGEFIGYGITIPTNAPQPEAAVDFIAFLLGSEGQEIMAANAHPLIMPPRALGYDAVPAALRELCVPLE